MLDKLTGVFVSFLLLHVTLHDPVDKDVCVYARVRQLSCRKCKPVLCFAPRRLLGPPPVPTSWGSACPSSSSWGTGWSTPWPETRSRRSACRGSSRSMARSAPTSPTLLDSWVSQCARVEWKYLRSGGDGLMCCRSRDGVRSTRRGFYVHFFVHVHLNYARDEHACVLVL